ncbi:MAG: helix-turn-helix domain-containing protein [Pseudomonadota bacterium]|nr:helix-turn-helix domain-containing protein [Pseudomonadota bacterium]
MKRKKIILEHGLPITRRGEGPNPIDIHVGHRLRLRRTLLGLSQDKLSEALGITFQQLQKYERGANRISASRLFNLSHILDVPVTWFFDGFIVPEISKGGYNTGGMSNDPLSDPDVLELVRAWHLIPDRMVRRKALALIRVLGGTEDGDQDDGAS